MADKKLSLDDRFIIVEAGVFGLNTSIHLPQRGYQNVTVFNKQLYGASQHSYFEGADAASADINKSIRSAYRGVIIYQALSLEAIEGWKNWTEGLASGQTVPSGMKNSGCVFIPNGNLIMTDGNELPALDLATVKKAKPGTQLLTNDPEHRRLAAEKGREFASTLPNARTAVWPMSPSSIPPAGRL